MEHDRSWLDTPIKEQFPQLHRFAPFMFPLLVVLLMAVVLPGQGATDADRGQIEPTRQRAAAPLQDERPGTSPQTFDRSRVLGTTVAAQPSAQVGGGTPAVQEWEREIAETAGNGSGGRPSPSRPPAGTGGEEYRCETDEQLPVPITATVVEEAREARAQAEDHLGPLPRFVDPVEDQAGCRSQPAQAYLPVLMVLGQFVPPDSVLVVTALRPLLEPGCQSVAYLTVAGELLDADVRSALNGALGLCAAVASLDSGATEDEDLDPEVDPEPAADL